MQKRRKYAKPPHVIDAYKANQEMNQSKCAIELLLSLHSPTIKKVILDDLVNNLPALKSEIHTFEFIVDSESIALSDEKRLIKDLLFEYDRVGVVGRPVLNTSDIISVRYGLALIQILDLDEKNQVLTTNCWSRYGAFYVSISVIVQYIQAIATDGACTGLEINDRTFAETWTDILLRWDINEYGGVDQIRIPTEKIWIPDIVLYNYADDRLTEHRNAYAVVSYDGTVLWIPQAIFKSSCVIDITHFPFDEQSCFLKFGSWTYDGFKLDIDFFSDLHEVDLNDYIISNEWDIIENPANKNVVTYTCCEEPYLDLTFTLKLRRKVAFYNYILILPCVLLSSLTLVLFWLPPESPAKMVLGMNIFVAFFVLLLLLAESTPPAASSIPLIGAYYCLNMIMITLSTFLSVIVINLYFRGDKKSTVPRWLKTLFIDFLARVMCMRAELIPEDYDKKRTPQGDAIHYVKNGKHKRRIKCPDLKYNKFQMYDLKDTANAGLANLYQQQTPAKEPVAGEQSGPASPDKSPIHIRYTAESDIKEIKQYLRQLLGRLHAKEERARIALEWRIVALVLDRLFFFMYLSAIVISLATIFPKTY
ncbi:hypothetical protein CAPTEDRAFT_218891 [Capitella teleta]|uniref:Neurotransmitter-gated ion-channel ligand-binding domain-containing protein n=1 Tax=Capitella teleta TaxID=283909 RepID=R7VCX6_CAPTE|nr:hypothetical protein CAPTEDRAFT_218891 [Capitella teleta]|eukprot:ELU16494.1 hypothetical protein CAPTEDRAFT_218891 [Capitella teleta]